MTSKERAALRAQANTIDTTLMVGKGGVSETLVAEAQKLLDIHELVKGNGAVMVQQQIRQQQIALLCLYVVAGQRSFWANNLHATEEVDMNIIFAVF